MSDRDIVDSLIKGNEKVNRQFFYENCRPLFMSIIKRVFPYRVEYDEFVSELYIYLMENDAARLLQFDGRSTIYQWLKTVALRFAQRLLKQRTMIDMDNGNLPYDEGEPCEEDPEISRMDVDNLLALMDNERQAYVIRRHVIEGVDEPSLAKELGIKVSNLYNIKRRAMISLSKVAFIDIRQYGNRKN
jgi:RNA polymerase sigma factor (sigma-70 family)